MKNRRSSAIVLRNNERWDVTLLHVHWGICTICQVCTDTKFQINNLKRNEKKTQFFTWKSWHSRLNCNTRNEEVS